MTATTRSLLVLFALFRATEPFFSSVNGFATPLSTRHHLDRTTAGFNTQWEQQRRSLFLLQASRTTNTNRYNKNSVEPSLDDDPQDYLSFSVELLSLGAAMTALTAFILVNQFVGPWPAEVFAALPTPAWLLLHYLGGVLFAGGIIVTTALEWLVVETAAASVTATQTTQQDDNKNKNIAMEPVLDFLFQRVPVMDAALVVPGLAVALVSGIAVATANYDGLATSPPHIVWAFRTLVAFAIWWAVTDVSTQGLAAAAVQEWKQQRNNNNEANNPDLPDILYQRRLSNIGSCLFVVALYALMALKPGTYF